MSTTNAASADAALAIIATARERAAATVERGLAARLWPGIVLACAED